MSEFIKAIDYLKIYKEQHCERKSEIDLAIEALNSKKNEPKDEPFHVTSADSRLVTLPIPANRMGTFKYYIQAISMFWMHTDIVLTQDIIDWKSKLTEDERYFVSLVLALFTSFDGIVNVNIRDRLLNEIDILEAKYFYNYQIMIEDMHAHTYSLLLVTLIEDIKHRAYLLEAVKTIPVIKAMADFMYGCINSDAPLGERLFRMACVEGIFFTGVFVVIFWLTNRGLMPGLGHSNELISKDECLHTLFSMHVYTMLKENHQISYAEMCTILDEAVQLAKEFMQYAIRNPMQGMNRDMVCRYIETKADDLLGLLSLPKYYNSTHSFKFMEQINIDNKTNFFERRPSDYCKAMSVDTVKNERTDDF